jgi:hypothetical protein
MGVLVEHFSKLASASGSNSRNFDLWNNDLVIDRTVKLP